MDHDIPVAKMSGAGNAFIVLGPPALAQLGAPSRDWIGRICKRGVSLGADGVLTVEATGENRVRVRFFNPDGSGAFCGNGSRCAARFASLHGLAGDSMILETLIGDVPATVSGAHVQLELPSPTLAGELALEVAQNSINGYWINAGVPHFIVPVDDVRTAPLDVWGPALRKHPAFGDTGVNVDVVAPTSTAELEIRTWERGVEGETLACGSGAVAAAFWTKRRRTTLITASGVPLHVEFVGDPEEPSAAILAGDARMIVEGRIGVEATTGFS
jgi:diaminopimelate epimerase